MQRLTVDLKTYLGLAMPNQCCHVVIILILGWFAGGIFFQETSTLNDPYIILYDLTHSINLTMHSISIPSYQQILTIF